MRRILVVTAAAALVGAGSATVLPVTAHVPAAQTAAAPAQPDAADAYKNE